ncbi:MAG: hypothetical protein M1818_000913 [Claussenomyces sp. TS43310]|nr:MAG: hypothetical protein M1818_000913 [Claussenomyces sp. TS43310]
MNHERSHLRLRHAHHQQHVDGNHVAELVDRAEKTVTHTVLTTMSSEPAGAIEPNTQSHSEDDARTSQTGILHASATSNAIVVSPTPHASAQNKASSVLFQSEIMDPSTSIPSNMGIVAATSTPVAIVASSSAAGTTSSPSSSSSPLSQDGTSSGMSAGGKAGLAIGIVLALAAVLSLVIFCFRQRKQAHQRQRLDDEKSQPPQSEAFADGRMASTRTAKTASTAPRLSLRPVTQFLPMFGEKRASRGNDLAMASTAGPRGLYLTPQATSRKPVADDSQNEKANPFGNHAEAVDAVHAEGPPVVGGASAGGAILAGPTVRAGATVGLARGASKRANTKQIDFTKALPPPGPPSPAGTEFSISEVPGTPVPTSGSAAIAAAGGPKNAAVHRVQLDFNPSMEDELELKAGQLIRLLHEYDDGWALCIRLDRSHQGVVPRTCLSTRPVKPRPVQNGPRGPPPPPGARVPQDGRSPSVVSMNQFPRPGSAQSNRGPGARYSPQGRPMTPKGRQERPSSPAGNRRDGPRQARSALAMHTNGDSDIAAESQSQSLKLGVERKPIPGQAL